MKQKENSKRVCEERKTIGIMQFGRKAPTPAEIRQQARERQQRWLEMETMLDVQQAGQLPLTEKQEAERREYTEMMRKRYIAAGIKV